MFKITDVNSFLAKFSFRQAPVKKPGPPVRDELYTIWLRQYPTTEITPDIILFGWEDAQKENAYVKVSAPAIATTYWMIGRTGQGDEWFIDLAQSRIMLYDHNSGEYEATGFSDLGVDFSRFLQLADVLQQLEDYLDREDTNEEALEAAFQHTVKSLDKDLYERYPFKYF